MTWDQIRQQHPDTWVVIEATNAHTANQQRVLDQIQLVDVCDDWQAAWRRYQSLHGQYPEREFYPVHTQREALDIGVIDAFGRTTSS